jgi:hypothetical protein
MGFTYKKGTEISNRNVEEGDEYYTDFSPQNVDFLFGTSGKKPPIRNLILWHMAVHCQEIALSH